mmetsp:Transcript_187/g.262  ORF Transcript_187/g.262 Transcript_187/m.262 type:complete len:392 (+) Transcript_187:158-1333(+)|eukprot:CAMPEP_0194203882 /NCGR_PEP_ID=MMETSP0156-20130528/3543_1 /TAXON_ID=33649 /ORGANISM="Thalassionema nitzschioides, Strain L26-B" /LENGTH=391 /DNA_ID=CAMNT_0038929731 /DNA_START=94 /DNA_END=1269 /DNA_ORIENTATION=-
MHDQLHERRKHKDPGDSTNDHHTHQASPGTGSKTVKTKKKRIVGGSRRNQSQELTLLQARGLLFFVACMYSSNFASIKYLETVCQGGVTCQHDPAEIAFSRFAICSLVCLPILYFNRQQWPLIRAGIECGLFSSLNYIGQAESLEFITAGKCCFIGTLGVVVVPIFRRIFLGKPLKATNLISAGIALLGVAILENIVPIFGKSKANMATVGVGDLLAMCQPLGFGFAIMRLEYYLDKYSHFPNRVATLTAAQFVCVCFIMFLWVLFDNKGRLPNLSYMLEIKHMAALFWLGVVTSLGSFLVQGKALQKASSSDAVLIYSTEPILASLMAQWLLGETLSSSTYAGGGVIVFACLFGSLADSGDDGGRKKKAIIKKKPYSKDSELPFTTRINK